MPRYDGVLGPVEPWKKPWEKRGFSHGKMIDPPVNVDSLRTGTWPEIVDLAMAIAW